MRSEATCGGNHYRCWLTDDGLELLADRAVTVDGDTESVYLEVTNTSGDPLAHNLRCRRRPLYWNRFGTVSATPFRSIDLELVGTLRTAD